MNEFDRNMLDEIEADERWLADFETPPASPELLDRIKLAARDELTRRHRRPGPHVWAPWQGGFAAAAMVLLAVGVGWYSITTHPTPQSGDYEALVESADASPDYGLVRLAAIGGGVEFADLEDRTDDGGIWNLSPTSIYDDMEAAFSEEAGDDLEDVGAALPVGQTGRITKEA